MGMIHDLATLIGAGITGEDIKAMIEIEKNSQSKQTDEPKVEPATETTDEPKVEPATETTDEPKVEPEKDERDSEIERLRAENEKLKKDWLNRDVSGIGSTPSLEDELNNIMQEMF